MNSSVTTPAPPSLEAIRAALGRQPAVLPPWDPAQQRACVAMILAGSRAAPQVCFIKRAERPNDPWSGQVAFPGGRAQPEDPSAQAVAERETREEVGLRLTAGQMIAPLAFLPVRHRGLETDMKLVAFAYEWSAGPASELPPLQPDRTEVAEAFWVPVSDLMDPGLRTRFRFTRNGAAMDFPAVDLGGRILWGLTYRILIEFGRRIGLHLPEE